LREPQPSNCMTIRELFSILEGSRSIAQIPHEPGVYFVWYLGGKHPEFLLRGPGGYHKGRDPNVSCEVLERNWIENETVVYIGKSESSLQERITTYMEFGRRKSVSHHGGRYIWQIRDFLDLRVCWRPLSRGSEGPTQVEGMLLLEFMRRHDGRLPFANLRL
jgi:hypothetical protein